jgi:hypothetical protein
MPMQQAAGVRSHLQILFGCSTDVGNEQAVGSFGALSGTAATSYSCLDFAVKRNPLLPSADCDAMVDVAGVLHFKLICPEPQQDG